MTNPKTETRKNDTDSDAPASAGRRAFLRAGGKAMPAVLTLHSGAALARSSNLISAAPAGTTDPMGYTMCLDTSTMSPVVEAGGVYDLGEPAAGTVNMIPDRIHRLDKNNGSAEIDESSMCELGGGPYWYKQADAGWQSLSINRGIVVSSAATASFAGSLLYRFW